MTKKNCPLGEDCDLTIAWMKSAEDARDKAKARIEALTEQLEAARLDVKEAEAYAVWLEAKLAKAVEALEKIAQHDMQYWAITTLAELKGETDK